MLQQSELAGLLETARACEVCDRRSHEHLPVRNRISPVTVRRSRSHAASTPRWDSTDGGTFLPPRPLVDRAVSAYTGLDMERELRTRVVRALEAHDVRLAYLFGSHAKGEATELSDIDLGVSFNVDIDAREAQGELLDALVHELRTERIDLVLLDEIPPPLAYRIIRDGARLLAEDPREDMSFRTRTIMRYLDFKPLRDAAFRSGREAILVSE